MSDEFNAADAMAHLRQLLSEPPSWKLWNSLIFLLDEWPESETKALALAYVESHLEASWPLEFRKGNDSWPAESVGWRLQRLALRKIASLPLGQELYCPSGVYSIGSATDSWEWEEEEFALHEVECTRSFWMQETMVTQQQWQEVMGTNPSLFVGEQNPVDRINWFQAVDFCNRLSRLEGLEPAYFGEGEERWGEESDTSNLSLVFWRGLDNEGYRLPTEMEWEIAARAGCSGSFYDEPDNLGWFEINAEEKTWPVKQKKPNAWGLYDMLGNLWEWTQDSWDARFFEDRRLPLSEMGTDPQHYEPENRERWLRGGAWIQEVGHCKLSSRVIDQSYVADEFAGLRVCRTAKEKGLK